VRQFSQIKKARVKINIAGKAVELKLRLTLWEGSQVPVLLPELQREVMVRVKRLLGPDNPVSVTCDVKGLEESESLFLQTKVKK
jgi:hypothetical protein